MSYSELLLVLLILYTVTSPLPAPGTLQVAPIVTLRVPVDRCMDIVESGIYELVGNINGVQRGKNYCIGIFASNVMLEGKGYSLVSSAYYYDGIGILVYGVSNVTIRDLVIAKYINGTVISNSAYVQLVNSTIRDFRDGYGVVVQSSLGVEIHGNTLIYTVNYYSAKAFIYMERSHGSNVTSNTILHYRSWLEHGIKLLGSSNNMIHGNSILVHEYGEFTYAIALYDSTRNAVSENYIACASHTAKIHGGIHLNSSHENTVMSNNVTKSNHGVYVMNSKDNLIAGNTLVENYIGGIYLWNSNHTLIFANTLIGNSDGIYMGRSSGNTLANNAIIASRRAGIYMVNSTGNTIYNNLFNNTVNADISGYYPNSWNTELQSSLNVIGGSWVGGNAWFKPDGKGYSQLCRDEIEPLGICDEPYYIAKDNVDYYPLSTKIIGPTPSPTTVTTPTSLPTPSYTPSYTPTPTPTPTPTVTTPPHTPAIVISETTTPPSTSQPLNTPTPQETPATQSPASFTTSTSAQTNVTLETSYPPVVGLVDQFKLVIIAMFSVSVVAIILATRVVMSRARVRMQPKVPQATVRPHTQASQTSFARAEHPVGIMIKNYEILEKIDEGAFAEVYKARNIENNRIVALKLYKTRPGPDDEKYRKAFINEISNFLHLVKNLGNVPYIVKPLDYDLKPRPFIVMDYYPLTLRDVIKDTGIELKKKLKLLLRVAEALSYAHSWRVYHGDLKPENILVFKENNEYYPAISDWGGGFTPCYSAPEVYESGGSKLTDKSDVFSFGVLLYEVLSGERLFRDSLVYLDYVRKGGEIDVKKIRSRELEELIKACLARNPAARPTIEEVKVKLANYLVDVLKTTVSRTQTAREHIELIGSYIHSGEIDEARRRIKIAEENELVSKRILKAMARIVELIELTNKYSGRYVSADELEEFRRIYSSILELLDEKLVKRIKEDRYSVEQYLELKDGIPPEYIGALRQCILRMKDIIENYCT